MLTQREVIEVGKALLPYLRNDLTPAELGYAAHDAAAALKRAASGALYCDRCGTIRRADDACPLTGRDDCPKGPAGERGQVGWMGGEFDR